MTSGIAASPTRRATVKLPPMPPEHTAAEACPPIAMARARIERARLVFDQSHGFAQALRQGFFLVQVPPTVDLGPGDLFVRNCFMPCTQGELAPYTGFKDRAVPGAYQGYFDREYDQWENLYIERNNWSLIPPAVVEL